METGSDLVHLLFQIWAFPAARVYSASTSTAANLGLLGGHPDFRGRPGVNLIKLFTAVSYDFS
jgi:hypothetical protein